jgi:hypothetical protein
VADPVLAQVGGGTNDESWEVQLTEADVCWSMQTVDRSQSSCRDRAAFDRPTAVGITGLRVVVRLTGLDVTEMQLDDHRMQSSEADDVRLFAGVAPSAPSATVVGRDSTYGVVLREVVEAPVVPNVVGLTSDVAGTTLQQLGFEVSATGDPSASTVLAQSVPAGTRDLGVGDVTLTFGRPLHEPAEIGTVLGEQDGRSWKVYGRMTVDGPQVCQLVQIGDHESVGGCETDLGDMPVVAGTEDIRIVFWRLRSDSDGASIDYGVAAIAMSVIEVRELRVAWAVVPKGPRSATVVQTSGGVAGESTTLDLAAS